MIDAEPRSEKGRHVRYEELRIWSVSRLWIARRRYREKGEKWERSELMENLNRFRHLEKMKEDIERREVD